jgi:alanyl aminopeptidase
VPAGRATIHIEYDAPFGPPLEGVHKVVAAGAPYVFTQFEEISARRAFPCFDEPGFKIPFDLALDVPAELQALANTHEASRAVHGSSKHVAFARTERLPSYLLAFAVGPLDVVNASDVPPNGVRAQPLPLRGVAPRGRGREMAYALKSAGELLARLEQYTGIAYPYDKLDLIAVPGELGAMENAGAITFGDEIVLLDPETATASAKRWSSNAIAHELAHQWTGDLVTASWWDDIWLNEAFATWLSPKIVDQWAPELQARVSLLQNVQSAMGSDSLPSARRIRQPIESTDDIANALDDITYQKGAAVLAMFERWLGPETFQRGLHDYLTKHRFGSATADDFLDAESAAAGKDVKAPFHSFLDQAGVPLLETEVRCGGAPRLHVEQSRFFPLGVTKVTGVTGTKWQIPVCVRYGVGGATKERCALVTETMAEIPLGAADDPCPAWALPNADAAGYYRVSLAPADLTHLRESGLAALSTRERVAYGNALRTAYNMGTLPMKDALTASAPLANDPEPVVAGEAMGFPAVAHTWLYDHPLRTRVELYARGLFKAQGARLGWTPSRGDSPERARLRTDVLTFLALTARDPAVRAEANRRGTLLLGLGRDAKLHADAVDPNLASLVATVAGEGLTVPQWESLLAKLAKTEDAVEREQILTALVSARLPELLPRVRELSFHPALRTSEVPSPSTRS